MKISIESEVAVSVFGFVGTVAFYRPAPLHEIFRQAVADKPGIRVSDLQKKFGLPMPACRRLLHPLLASGVLRASDQEEDFSLEAEPTSGIADQLPVHLLMDDWLMLVLAQPFHGHRVLGVVPAARFPVDRSELRPNTSLREFHRHPFSASGTYSFQLGDDKPSDFVKLRAGILIETMDGSTAVFGSKQAKLIEDADGSRLSMSFAGKRLILNLNLASTAIRPDLATLGQQAVRQQNSRMGHPADSTLTLRKRFVDLNETEKSTARGSLNEPVKDVLVHLQDLPVLPHSEACYQDWVKHLFIRNLETHGYADAAELRAYLANACTTLAAAPYSPPTVEALVPRLRGKAKMLARALADWPTLSS